MLHIDYFLYCGSKKFEMNIIEAIKSGLNISKEAVEKLI